MLVDELKDCRRRSPLDIALTLQTSSTLRLDRGCEFEVSIVVSIGLDSFFQSGIVTNVPIKFLFLRGSVRYPSLGLSFCTQLMFLVLQISFSSLVVISPISVTQHSSSSGGKSCRRSCLHLLKYLFGNSQTSHFSR